MHGLKPSILSMGWVWNLLNSFLFRFEKNSKTPIYVFLVGCKPCLRVVYECSFDFG